MNRTNNRHIYRHALPLRYDDLVFLSKSLLNQNMPQTNWANISIYSEIVRHIDSSCIVIICMVSKHKSKLFFIIFSNPHKRTNAWWRQWHLITEITYRVRVWAAARCDTRPGVKKAASHQQNTSHWKFTFNFIFSLQHSHLCVIVTPESVRNEISMDSKIIW